MADAFQRDVHCLLGLPFDAVDMAGALRLVRDAAARRQRCFFSTPNLNFVVACRADEQFRDSVLHSDLSIADGMPVVWIARLLRIPIRERVAGSDLFDALRRASGQRLSVFFFGGPDGAAAAACRRLASDGGGLACAGHAAPGFGSIEDMSSGAIIERINASRADLLVVSLGARKGQAWIERNLARLEVPVISHLGAVLNFVAGTVSRAPAWMQENGLEWLWRIKEDPLLWRRYLRDGAALAWLLATRVLPYAWYLRLHETDAGQLAAAGVEEADEGNGYLARLRGAWTRQNIAPLRECFSRAAAAGKDVRLDMAGVTCVDSAFVGLLLLLHGLLKRQGRVLQLAAVPRPVRRVMKYCCAEFLHADAV